MGGPDVPAALKAANTRRHQAALAAARGAIATLQRSGSTISFTAVAKSSGVARSWLYQQAELRQLIGRLRTAGPHPPSTTSAPAPSPCTEWQKRSASKQPGCVKRTRRSRTS